MEHQKITAFILDDELMAITKLTHQLSQIKDVEIIGHCQSPIDAIQQIQQLKPKVVFLDINMSDLDGFDVLPSLPEKTLVVFTTAYGDYALKAFEKSAADYLLKPFDTERLQQAVQKVKTLLMDNSGIKAEDDGYEKRLISKQGDRILIVNISDIYFVKSTAGGVCAYGFNKVYPIGSSLDQLESQLDPNSFIRLHRSYMININYIKEIQRWFGGKLMLIMSDEKKTELNSSREGAKKVKQFFSF